MTTGHESAKANARAKARASQRWLALVVLSVLLVAQWLSLTHAVAHGSRACRDSAATASCEARFATAPRGSWVDSLWNAASHHDDKAPLCLLIDHLCQAAPSPAPAGLAAATGVHPLAEVTRVAHWVSRAPGHYRARAPPAFA